jgi:hypothetical protein
VQGGLLAWISSDPLAVVGEDLNPNERGRCCPRSDLATDTSRPATRAPLRQPASPRQLAAWAAWGSCAAYWVLIVTGYTLVVRHGTVPDPLNELAWRIGYGSFATVGAIIAARRPGNRIGWILCAVGLAAAVASFAQDYATFALLGRRQWLPGGLVLGWLGSWP